MDLIPKVILITGACFDYLKSQSLESLKRTLFNNGFKLVLTERDGSVEKIQRPSNKRNSKSTFCIYRYQDIALVHRY